MREIGPDRKIADEAKEAVIATQNNVNNRSKTAFDGYCTRTSSSSKTK